MVVAIWNEIKQTQVVWYGKDRHKLIIKLLFGLSLCSSGVINGLVCGI